MTTRAAPSRVRTPYLAALAALAALTLISAALTRDVVNDDPYITYRYARNLAAGAGFVYNPGEPVLSTTAPLFAFLLAALSILGIEPPTASLVVGAIAAFVGSALVYRIGRRADRPTAGFVAAILLATSPLVWMATGMESSLYLALAIGALDASGRGRWRIAGLLAGSATLVRGDGVLVVILVALAEWTSRRRLPWKAVSVAAALVVPAALAATLTYGHPLPATLRAKTLQAGLGITGFFPGAQFPDGMWSLATAYWQHSALYAAAIPLLSAGLIRLRRERWAWTIVAWGALQAIGYTTIGVAPYRWYYIPILPALCVLIAIGAATLARPPALRAAGYALALALLAAQARSVWEIHRSTDPSVARSELVGIDALPETSGPLYRQVGDWLRERTPPDASVGVMEVGVIGYTAGRRMIDYLGLLRPDVAEALGRRDMYWSIPHTQPDYLVLTAVNPLYSYDLLADAWFQATYRPVARFDDPRFWGSPITVYQRRRAATRLDVHPVEMSVAGMRLVEYAAEPVLIRPRTPMRIRLAWAAPAAAEARVTVSLIGPQGHVAAADSRTVEMAGWPPSGGSVYHTMVTGPDAPPGLYRALVDVQAGRDAGQATVGRWKSPLGEVSLPRDLVPRSDLFGEAIELIGYTLEPRQARAGEVVALTLYWQSARTVDRDFTVFVHVENERGDLALAADGQPRAGDYPTSIWSPGEVIPDTHSFQLPGDLPSGSYAISTGLYLLDTGERMVVAEEDRVVLGSIAVR